MKTIEQLEKEFDKKDFYDYDEFEVNGLIEGRCELNKEKIKNYIFQELLPQVLSEIIDIDDDWIEKDSGLGRVIKEKLKQKAKEMGINLPE